MALLRVSFSAFLSAFICPPCPPHPHSLHPCFPWIKYIIEIGLCARGFKKKGTYSFLFNVYSVLPVCMTVQHVHAWYPQRLWSPETEVTDGCKLPVGLWRIESGPSERLTSPLNNWAICPAPDGAFFKIILCQF